VPHHDTIGLAPGDRFETLGGIQPPGLVAGLDRKAQTSPAPIDRLTLEPTQQHLADALTSRVLPHPQADLRRRLVNEAVARITGGKKLRPHHPDRLTPALGHEPEVSPFRNHLCVVTKLRPDLDIPRSEALLAPVQVA